MAKENPRQHDNKKGKRVRAMIITLIADLLFAVLAYYIARSILFFRLDNELPKKYLNIEVAIAAASVIITVVMLLIFDCYNAIWKYAGRVEFFKFMLAYISTFATLFLMRIILRVAGNIQFWTSLMLIYLLFSAIFSGVLRFFYGIGQYLRHIRFWVDDKSLPKDVKRTIVIGAGYTGSLAINRFIHNPSDGYYPVCIIDDDEEKHDKRVYGIVVEGGVEKIPEAVEKYKAEAFVIAIMSITKSQLRRIYNACSVYNLPIKIMPPTINADEMTNSVKSLRDIKIEELLGRDEFKVKQELIDSSVKDKVVMVTGGAGSIGSELCRQVLNFGCKHLVIFDQHENGMFFLNQEFVQKYDTSRYTLVMGTVRERDKLVEVLAQHKPDVIFHAAAYKHVPMMEIAATEAIKNNVFGTLNVIECAEQAGVKKFVLVSTDKAVNPSNIMGASKRIAEMVIETRGKKFNMQMAAVRFGNVLGSNGSVIPVFLKQIKDGGPITLTDRWIKRYFMSIPEAVRLVLQTGAFASSGEIFVLDMGDPVKIYDLAVNMIRLSGFEPFKDIDVKVTGLRPGEKLYEERLMEEEGLKKTENEKISIGKPLDIDEKKLFSRIELLVKQAEEETESMKDLVSELVPTYVIDRK